MATNDHNTDVPWAEHVPSTLEGLKSIFMDDSIGFFEREHAFCAFWRERLKTEGNLSRIALAEMLVFLRWRDAIGDIVKRLCVKDDLSLEDANWLIDNLPEDYFARDQVLALLTIKDNSLSWETKLRRVFGFHANWAAAKILATLPVEEAARARMIVREYKQPKCLLHELDRRAKSSDLAVPCGIWTHGKHC